jgi:hypothetical protein
MALYAFHDLTLEVNHQEAVAGQDLPRILEELSWVSAPHGVKEPTLHLSISRRSNGLRVPTIATPLFQADGFSAFESQDDFYITDGSSLLHLRPVRGEGTAFIASSFSTKPQFLQSNFWAFSLLKLFRPLGLYSLHAAGLVTKRGLGLLLVGPSGSGKSTLAIGLIRQGWHYLSDDAVLLRPQAEGVEALALRKHFYVDTDAAASPVELPLGEEVPDSRGRRRRRVCLEGVYAEQYAADCFPQVLLFCRIVPQAQSTLIPLNQVHALKHLLASSGPQLFDKSTMSQHLDVLKTLVQQTSTYELRAGVDLYRDPRTLGRLLNEAEGEQRWPEL